MPAAVFDLHEQIDLKTRAHREARAVGPLTICTLVFQGAEEILGFGLEFTDRANQWPFPGICFHGRSAVMLEDCY